MKQDGTGKEESRIDGYILAYLAEHPNAEDTLEGIMSWWLLEQRIKYETARVRRTLCDLISKGIIVECRTQNLQVRYRVNKSKKTEIRKILKELPGFQGTG